VISEIEHYTIKKGGSDPVMIFGPQAGRKQGVAPALSAYLPAYQFCDPGLVWPCAVKGYKIHDRKPTRKPSGKPISERFSIISTVFQPSNPDLKDGVHGNFGERVRAN
jgi:hypothetical protein